MSSESSVLQVTQTVGKCWQFEISDKLYDLLKFDKHSWYSSAVSKKYFKSTILDTIHVKSDALICNDQGGAYNELVIIAVNDQGWFHPSTINYMPLSINYVTHLNIYLTDANDNSFKFPNSQFVLVLHLNK